MTHVLNYQVLAEFLKYAGLIVGTASSIWGAVNELKEEDPNGRKQLSLAGKTSIAITVVSLIVSLTSAAVGDKLAREADKRAEDKRARATNEILTAAQSLRAISLTWSFPHGDSAVDALFKKYDSDVDDLNEEWGFDPHQAQYYSQLYHLNYNDVVRSLLNLLGGANSDDQTVLAMFSLDDAGAVVLPVGFVKVDQLGKRDRGKLIQPRECCSAKWTLPLKDIDVAAGIALSGESTPVQRRTFTSDLALPQVSRSGKAVELSWILAGVNSIRAIDKSDPSLIAVLPQQMEVVILTDIRTLPVNPNQTSESTFPWPFWHRDDLNEEKDLTPEAFRDSRLTLVPNGITNMAATYEMKLVLVTPVHNTEPDEFYCSAAIWRGRRVQGEP